jgi:hypothetical protein
MGQGLSGPGGDPSSLNTRPLKEGDKTFMGQAPEAEPEQIFSSQCHTEQAVAQSNPLQKRILPRE